MRLKIDKSTGSIRKFNLNESITGYDNPLDVTGEYQLTESGTLWIKGIIKTEIPVVCDRCLKALILKMEVPFEEEFIPKNIGSEEDYLFDLEGADMDVMVLQLLNLNYPEKILCDTECLGLCPSCGCNLNDGPCQCDTREMNPKFEKLKSLLEDR